MSHENNETVEADPAHGRAHDCPPAPGVLKTLPKDGGDRFNRLVFQKSPYLLQHACNPVDWYPWGEEAFEKARELDRPVLLSIGYATCHWCHEMERESFEDPEVAGLMNETFISIKVDREERPDVDQIYMAVCQALTGQGGWPLTVVLTPERKPFFAGTYFPKQSIRGRIGMMDLIPQVRKLWEEQRSEIERSAVKITGMIEQMNQSAPGAPLGADTLKRAFQVLETSYDARHGGFAGAPKFPTPHTLRFLLRYGNTSSNGNALRMVEKTLEQIRLGGIYDHVGFGLHRYSTDERWLLPHFEKMLYDQALMAGACVEAYLATGREEFARTAREIFTYVTRDMTSPGGGFYSAEDADSEGEEGKFYLWSTVELAEVLGGDEARFFAQIYNARDTGNFLEQTTGKRSGANILHLDLPLRVIAGQKERSGEDFLVRIESARRKLFSARAKRVRPLKDDKILTDWNGLMISAFAEGYQALGDPRLLDAAEKAQAFLQENLMDGSRRLMKRYRDGQASGQGLVDDYAFVIQGLLDLYEAGFAVAHLSEAIRLNRIMLEHFWDREHGGFFMTADDGEALIVRPKEVVDAAIPSGNSVAALNLLRLSRMTGNQDLETKAWELFSAFSVRVSKSPGGYAGLLTALDFALGPTREVVIAGDLEDSRTQAMVKALRSVYFPRKVVLVRPQSEKEPSITKVAKFTEHQTALDGKPTAYVCTKYACKAPTTDAKKMVENLLATD